MKVEFRRITAGDGETAADRVKEAFAVLQALRHHSYALHHGAASSRSSSSLSSAQFSQVFGCSAVSPFHSRAGRLRMDEDEDEDEDDEEDEDEDEAEEDEEEQDEAERMEEEAAALLEAGDLSDHPEASSIIRSALSALGQVQLMSAGATPLLRLTLKNREGEQEQGQMTPAADGGRSLQEEMEAARARLRQRQQQKREGEAAAAAEEMDDEDEDDAVTREDIAEREDDLAQLQLAALTEGKQRDATLLSLHPFTADELQAVQSQHAALTRALSRKQVRDEEVNTALHFFLSPSLSSSAPLWLRLTAEDYHRLFHYWLGWEDKQEADDGDEAAAEMEEQAEDEQQQQDDSGAWSLRHRHALFSRMKESGYSLKRSLVRRALRTAKSRGGVVEAMVMLRETSVGRLLPRPGDVVVQLSSTQQRRMAAFANAMRGVYDLDADMLTVKPPPAKRAASKRWAAAANSGLLKADAPLLELAIEAAAAEEHTEAVRLSYPARLCSSHLPQPPTALSACSFPLTPASSPTSQPHPSLELFALMLQHELPLTRASTVNWLLYVCDTLQLPDVAAMVVLKAVRDSPQLVTADLLDVLVTIACNASHLQLALRALQLYSRLNLQPPLASYANVVNYALWGPQQTVQEAVVDGWLREQRLRLTGWPDVRQRLLFGLLEEAEGRGLRGEQVAREAQRIIGRELARSMKDGLREVERFIRMKESEHWQERFQQQTHSQHLQDDEDDDDDDDGH